MPQISNYKVLMASNIYDMTMIPRQVVTWRNTGHYCYTLTGPDNLHVSSTDVC